MARGARVASSRLPRPSKARFTQKLKVYNNCATYSASGDMCKAYASVVCPETQDRFCKRHYLLLAVPSYALKFRAENAGLAAAQLLLAEMLPGHGHFVDRVMELTGAPNVSTPEGFRVTGAIADRAVEEAMQARKQAAWRARGNAPADSRDDYDSYDDDDHTRFVLSSPDQSESSSSDEESSDTPTS
jgi:hypothetical protein